jgi:hypothetical protein
MDPTQLAQLLAQRQVSQGPPANLPPRPSNPADHFAAMPMGQAGANPRSSFGGQSQEGFLSLLREEQIPINLPPQQLEQAIAQRIQLYRQEAARSRNGADFSAKANMLENMANSAFRGMEAPPGGVQSLPYEQARQRFPGLYK